MRVITSGADAPILVTLNLPNGHHLLRRIVQDKLNAGWDLGVDDGHLSLTPFEDGTGEYVKIQRTDLGKVELSFMVSTGKRDILTTLYKVIDNPLDDIQLPSFSGGN